MATVKEDDNGMKRIRAGSKENNVTLAENITNSNTKKPMSKPVLKGDLKCECCPYGYHIDLDFVNYCEELYNGTYHHNLKRLYRDHRRYKKAPEICDGLHTFYLGKPRSKSSDPPLLKSSLPDYSENYHERWLPSRSHHSHLHPQKSPTKEIKVPSSDVLLGQKSSRTRNNDDNTNTLPNNIHLCPLSPSDVHSPTSVIAASHSRSDSNSSLSSTSTECSANLHMLNSPSAKCTCGSQQIADTMATLNSASVINNGLPAGYVGINTNILSTIRSQVATSLHRMKELEEQAKAVPILQVKLSVLKEEKRLLMLQLKNKDVNLKHKLLHTGESNTDETEWQEFLRSWTLPRFRKRTLSGTSLEKRSIPLYSSAERLASDFDDPFEKSNTIDLREVSSFQQSFKPSEQVNSSKQVKSIGTNCTVLTRDIGVGHIAERLRSVGIGDDIVSTGDKKCLKCGRTYTNANIHSDSLSSSEFAEDEFDEERKETSKLNILKHDRSIQKMVEVVDKSTSIGAGFLDRPILTYNKHEGISIPPTIIRCSKCEERSQIKFKNCASQSKLINCLSSGINTDQIGVKNIGTSTDLHAKCISFGTNTEKTSLNDASQSTELSMQEIKDLQLHQIKRKQMKDKGTGVPRPLLGNAKTQTINHTKDSSTSFDIECHHVSVQAILPITDESKSKEKFHTQVKSLYTKSVQTDFAVNTHDASCGNCSIHDTFCNRCELRQMETIGVGNDNINNLICDHCQHANYVDVAVGEDKPPILHSVGVNTKEGLNSEGSPTAASGVHICDKCNAKIKSVAKDLVDKNIDNVFHPSFAHSLTSSVDKENSMIKGKVEKSQIIKVHVENHHTVTQEKKLSRKETLTKLVVNKRSSEHTGSGSEATDSSDSPSAESPDEKLYDGILNRIISRHRDGGSLNLESTEQITRKKAELSEEMKKACKLLNESLTSQTVSEKELAAAMEVIQKEWFHVSSKKHSDPHCVEDYLDAFEEMSKHLLHTVVNLKDANGNTAMHYAVSHGNFDVVSVLLDSKVCDANIQNKAGYTSVMLISLAEIKNDAHKHVVQRLFQINEINLKAAQNGQTALMLAASQGRSEAVKLLLECGAEINMQDKDGSTALMCAAEHGHADVVHVLLANPDCDATLVDNDGSSALSIAMEVGHRDVALVIYAKVNFSRGNSPYSSLRTRRTKSTSSNRSSLPPATPPRTPPPPSPRPRKNSSSF